MKLGWGWGGGVYKVEGREGGGGRGDEGGREQWGF